MTGPDKATLVQVWSGVQENLRNIDASVLKLRGLAMAYLAALVAAGTSLQLNDVGIPHHAVGPLVLLAAIPWVGIYVMDRVHYHRRQLAEQRRARLIERTLLGDGSLQAFSTLEDALWSKLRITWRSSEGALVSLFYGSVAAFFAYFGFGLYAAAHWKWYVAPMVAVASLVAVALLFMWFEHSQAKRLRDFDAEP